MYRSSFVCLVSKQHQVPEGRVHSYSRSLKGDRQGERLLSHLICTIVLVSTFSLNWQLQKYEQGCTLFFFFFCITSSFALQLYVTQKQKTPISGTSYAAHKVLSQFSPSSNSPTPLNFFLIHLSLSQAGSAGALFSCTSDFPLLTIILITGTCKAVEDTNKSPTFYKLH